MPDSSPSSTDNNNVMADATNLATERATNRTPDAYSYIIKKPENLEKQFAERFRVGDRIQVSKGRGVSGTIYTIESISNGEVTVRDGHELLRIPESKLRKVN